MTPVDEVRIRLEGRAEVLEAAVREGLVTLRALEEGQVINLCDSLWRLKSSDVSEAAQHAQKFTGESRPLRTTLDLLASLQRELPRVIRARLRTLVLPETGTDEACASRLVEDPICRATSLEVKQTDGGRVVLCAVLLLGATQGLLLCSPMLSAAFAVLAFTTIVWFLRRHTDLLRAAPIILTRTRLIVGRRAFPIAEIRRVTVDHTKFPAVQLMHGDGTRTLFMLRPPSWLIPELRRHGIELVESWYGLRMN